MLQFNADVLVLTANQRLAQVIHQNYDQQQQAQGHRVWDTPLILPLRSWLRNLWHTHCVDSDQILTNSQEQQLWAQIIQETRQSLYPLLHVDNTAQLAQQAWQLLNYWQIPLEKINQQAITPEVSLFINWADQFIRYCQRHHWLSEATLPARLQAAFIRHPAPLPKQIRLCGFDELPPAYRDFLQILKPFTQIVEADTPTAKAHSFHLQTCTDAGLEISTMAQWAKMQLEKNPHANIGCVVPQLTQHRATIAHIFKQVFTQQTEYAFNISAGQTLTDFEIITAGLQTLALNTEKLPLELMSSLLQSPYLCQHATDIHLGAMLDVECHKLGSAELPLAAVYSALAKWQTAYPEHTWLKRLRAFAAIQPANPLQLPSAWSSYFAQQLQALGWPGGRGLNSVEYQVITRWQELLAELAGLDPITGAVNRNAALHYLQRLTGQTIFQPKTESHAPIQILGVLESSGFNFDALWIMGLDDQNWPPAAKPNPFLPYSLQIQQHIPHSSAQRELKYAQTITQRLLHSAAAVWVSCSAPAPDQSARFSRLIFLSPTSSESIPTVPLLPNYAESIFNLGHREQLNDDYGPALPPMAKIRGGSGIFTQQAQCPFRAFAVYRLNAVGLGEPELGISPLTHGILIHDALERLWKQLKNQQTLLATTAIDLENLITTIVDRVINDELPQPNSTFAQIEKLRLIAIIHEWLTLEKQRPPFQVIEQESERMIEFAGLNLHLKIDRIDQLSNGSQLLIDYKTGLTTIQAWLGERLQQPQLPLYAIDIAAQNHFSGIAFAQLNVSNLGFKGLHAEHLESESYFPRGIINVESYKDLTAPKTWADLLSHWRTVLQKLAMDFHNGYAAVDPAPGAVSPCQTCDLQSLCRIQL